MNGEEEERFLGTLSQGLTSLNLSLSDAQTELCLRYAETLVAVNERMNLTRITAPEEMAVKHFVDSLSVLRAVPRLSENASVIDVGTGAGFPGLVLKIARPYLRLVLLDSVAKRLRFLSETATLLGLENVRVVHARAEDAGRDPLHREHYDLVTARAVASLPTLLEWCGPLVRVGGTFVAMKGPNAGAEQALADNATRLLSLHCENDLAISLPATSEDTEPAERHLLVYRKTRPTVARFPRLPVEISAQPL